MKRTLYLHAAGIIGGFCLGLSIPKPEKKVEPVPVEPPPTMVDVTQPFLICPSDGEANIPLCLFTPTKMKANGVEVMNTSTPPTDRQMLIKFNADTYVVGQLTTYVEHASK